MCVTWKVAPPEEGIEVLTWSLDELSQAIVDGRFDHALHVAVVMIAVLKGGSHAARSSCMTVVP